MVIICYKISDGHLIMTGQGIKNLAGKGDPRFESGESTILAGAGIALVNLDFIRDEVNAGELVVLESGGKLYCQG